MHLQYMSLGLQLTLFGMVTVFVALGSLALILRCSEVLTNKQKVAAASAENQVQNSLQESDELDPELIAVITGAVSMMMAKERGYVPSLRITSIKPASDAWRMQGRTNLVS